MNRLPKAKPAVIATLGVDIGKNTFYLIGLDKRGAIVRCELAAINLTSVGGEQ